MAREIVQHCDVEVVRLVAPYRLVFFETIETIDADVHVTHRKPDPVVPSAIGCRIRGVLEEKPFRYEYPLPRSSS